tara:strand:- start:520 stop:1212 length:693 start_codon:yes stop_codon:yes gene_type:complete
MARTSKSRGAGPFQMRSGNKSPYKFLGKALRKVGSKLGIGGGNDPVAGAPGAQRPSVGPGGAGLVDAKGNRMSFTDRARADMEARKANPMMNMNPFMKKEKGYTPYKQLKASSPLKGADPILVKGARDAATGFGTVKYGQIAGARAWTDMVDTVEDTVNRSSKTKLAKNRRASKRYTKSKEDMNAWLHRRNKKLGRRNKLRERLGKEPLDSHGTSWDTVDRGPHGGGRWD